MARPWSGKNRGRTAQVIVHVGDDPLHVVLHGLDRRIGGREPELLVRVQAEVLGNVEDTVQAAGSPSPFHRAMVSSHHMAHSHMRQPIHRLEIHDSAKAFDMIHEPGSISSCRMLPGLPLVLQSEDSNWYIPDPIW